MSEPATESEKATHHLERITEVLGSGTQSQVTRLLDALHPAEIAGLLESLPIHQRKAIWELVPAERDGDVLLHVNDEVRAGLLVGMDSADIVAATSDMDVDDLADLLQELPEALLAEVLRAMDRQNRKRVEAVLSYPEDTAGGLMNTDVVTVRADVSLDVVLRYLRMRGQLPALTDTLFVLSRMDRYVGTLPLQALVTQSLDLTVAEVMGRDLEAVHVALPQDQIARMFQDRDLVSAPVVDDDGHLLGRITIDDVVDVIREEADHSILSTVASS